MVKKVNKSKKVLYAKKLALTEQVDAEEEIAAYLHDRQESYLNGFDDNQPEPPFSQADCLAMGRDLLYVTLRRFRPDLFVDFDKKFRRAGR